MATTSQCPQVITDRFKKFCRETFGIKDGDFMYRFYIYFFSPTRFRRQGANKSMSVEDKINNITHLISKSGKENVLACAMKFDADCKKGFVKTHSINYFTAAAERYKVSPSEMKVPDSSKPVKFMRVRDEFEDDSYNWDYKCSCGEIIDPWTSTCKKCNAVIDWRIDV